MKLYLLCIFALVAFSAFAEEQPTYTVDMSQWTVREELKDITGLKLPEDWDKQADFVSSPIVDETLPSKWDWRDRVAQAPEIVSQGNCGSCWAFGTAACMKWAIAILFGNAVPLSEQEILSCSKSGTCGGGYFAHGYQNGGASLAEEFPYVARDVKCKTGLSRQYKISRWGYIGERGRKPSVDEIKRNIMEHGAVGVTVTANGAMQAYKSGVFNGCSNGGTNHIVHIIGWDNDLGTWTMGNSWGKNWGEQGYMKIKFGCSRIGEIATFVDMKL